MAIIQVRSGEAMIDPINIYVDEREADWKLTTFWAETYKLASIRHLEADVRDGGQPFDGNVRVEEGIFRWNPDKGEYVDINKMQRAAPGNHTDNRIALILKSIGILTIVIGAIIGLLNGGGLYFVLFKLFISIAVGMLIVGVSEIIRLLHAIATKDERNRNR